MRRPLKRSRKYEKEEEEFETGSGTDSVDTDNDMLPNVRNGSDDDDNDDENDDENGHEFEIDGEEESGVDESDEDGDEEEEDVEGGEVDEDEEEDVEEGGEIDEDDEENEDGEEEGKLNEEMEQLEKEYKELRNQELDLLSNIRRNKDEDIVKGQAVKNQKALWDKTLEFRILLQKAFSSSNRLPQEPVRSLFLSSGDEVSDAYSGLINSSKKTLDSMLELQEALLEKNPAIAQSAEGSSAKHPKRVEASGNSNGEDEEWSKISHMQSRMASFRNKAIDKFHRKTQVNTGAAAIKGKLQAFNQSVSEQVAAYMRDPSKMIKGMQQNKAAVALFGSVHDSPDNIKQEVVNADGDPELLDDIEFYQQLLKEFIEAVDPTSSETAFYALKRLQTKKRKIVDRRASKSRKIRYNVHEKIVNFMAPQPMKLPDMAPKLFQNLFGLRSQIRQE